jgi:hypothetical protein
MHKDRPKNVAAGVRELLGCRYEAPAAFCLEAKFVRASIADAAFAQLIAETSGASYSALLARIRSL